jgi:hypothetical protein
MGHTISLKTKGKKKGARTHFAVRLYVPGINCLCGEVVGLANPLRPNRAERLPR